MRPLVSAHLSMVDLSIGFALIRNRQLLSELYMLGPTKWSLHDFSYLPLNVKAWQSYAQEKKLIRKKTRKNVISGEMSEKKRCELLWINLPSEHFFFCNSALNVHKKVPAKFQIFMDFC